MFLSTYYTKILQLLLCELINVIMIFKVNKLLWIKISETDKLSNEIIKAEYV